MENCITCLNVLETIWKISHVSFEMHVFVVVSGVLLKQHD